SDSDSEFSSAVISMNSSNSEKISSSRRVPSMEWRILLHSSRRESKSSSKISLITSILKHVSSFDVKKRPSQDEGKFAVFFHFENNEISRKGLRVLRDSFAYKEYGIRLMLAPRSAKALQEKVLLKLHGIRKLHGSPSFGGTLFWIIAELSSLRKAITILKTNMPYPSRKIWRIRACTHQRPQRNKAQYAVSREDQYVV
ncbi:hypothetical protein Tco_1440924, partial [Tanacetum coccineum]